MGGWREIARAPSDWAPSHLSIVGGRLLVHGTLCGPDGCRDAGWYSADGMTWAEATIPGDHPVIADMTVTPDGSMAIAVGAVSDWETYDAGAVWSTRDGIEWTQAQAPPVRELDWVAASDDAIVVSGGDALWASKDLEEWRRVKGPDGMRVAFGPGGLLAFGGGGQDLVSSSEVWQSPDGLAWTKVKLPRALRKGSDAFGGIDVFALDDGWILVPENVKMPKAVYISSDGRDWRRAPRPPWMQVGYVWWIDDLGDDVQAFGWAPDRRKQPNAMWTWQPGQEVGRPVLWHQDRIGRPVVWGGYRIALGEPSNNRGGVTLWRWEPTAEES